MRSTRIRTTDDSMLVVPNGKPADATIANLGSRNHRLLNTALVAQYDTPSDQLIALTNGLREFVGRHPKVVPGRTHAAVHALRDYGIEVGLSVYLDTHTAHEERAVRQELLVGVLRLVERLGVKLGTMPAGFRLTVPSVQARTAAR
jgi:MscS family membrane protein